MKVGIVGAGTMGKAIAEVFALAGWNVVLTDISMEISHNAQASIAASFKKRFDSGKISAETAACAELIAAGEIADCHDCDLIVEAAAEKADIKMDTFSKLDPVCKTDCIFASNTSSISITQLSAGITHPIVGMHFFNPATKMKLVEIISGLNTPEYVVERACEIAVEIGKEPVRVLDDPGFVVNRILTPMLNEAISVLAAGTATAEDIDKAMVLGCNMPMGPLKLCDLCGLDVVLSVCNTLQSETGDPKYRPHPLLRKMVRAGKLGIKSGEGFYCYDK